MPISTNWNSTQKIPHTFFTHFNWTTVIFDFPGKLTYHGELLKLEMSGESSATSEAAAQFATVAFRTASSVPQLLNYTLLERDTFDETACWPMQTSMWTVICWINQSHLLANKEGLVTSITWCFENFMMVLQHQTLLLATFKRNWLLSWSHKFSWYGIFGHECHWVLTSAVYMLFCSCKAKKQSQTIISF